MEGKYSVYVIVCDEKRFYIGLSADIKRRIDAHNKKLSKWTSRFVNWRKIYEKEFDSYTEARKWELYLKNQKGGNVFKKIIAEYGGS
jgi:predicted GIY-YIG superfamily endonuclease